MHAGLAEFVSFAVFAIFVHRKCFPQPMGNICGVCTYFVRLVCWHLPANKECEFRWIAVNSCKVQVSTQHNMANVYCCRNYDSGQQCSSDYKNSHINGYLTHSPQTLRDAPAWGKVKQTGASRPPGHWLRSQRDATHLVRYQLNCRIDFRNSYLQLLLDLTSIC